MPSIHKEICEVCIKSDVLCPACEEKYRSGKIKEEELKIARFLEKLKEKFKVLKNAQIYKIAVGDEQIIIIARKGDASKVVGKNGSIVKILSKEFKKSVKVVEFDEDMKKLANKIVYPASVEGVNVLYKKDNTLEYRIRIPKHYKNKINENLLKEIMSSIFSQPVEIIEV